MGSLLDPVEYMRLKELERALAAGRPEARWSVERQAPRRWRWRVEPGKEADFALFHDSFLPGIESVADTTPQPRRQVVAGTARRPPAVAGGPRRAGRALVHALRRLLEWSSGPTSAPQEMP